MDIRNGIWREFLTSCGQKINYTWKRNLHRKLDSVFVETDPCRLRTRQFLNLLLFFINRLKEMTSSSITVIVIKVNTNSSSELDSSISAIKLRSSVSLIFVSTKSNGINGQK